MRIVTVLFFNNGTCLNRNMFEPLLFDLHFLNGIGDANGEIMVKPQDQTKVYSIYLLIK